MTLDSGEQCGILAFSSKTQQNWIHHSVYMRESELTKIFVEKQTSHSIFIFWSVVICKMKYTTFFFFKQLYFSIFTKMPSPLYSSLPYPVTLCNVPIMSSSNLSLFSMVTCWAEKWPWKHMRITDLYTQLDCKIDINLLMFYVISIMLLSILKN